MGVAAVAAVLVASGCTDPGAQPELINGWDHPIEVYTDVYVSYSGRHDAAVLRTRYSTVVLQPGESDKPVIPGWAFDSVDGMILGVDDVKYFEWGVDVTGSHQFVVEGDLCLEPAPADPDLS